MQNQYPGQWVAAHKRRIVAVGANQRQVAEEAARVTGRPWNMIAVVYIHSPEDFLNLGPLDDFDYGFGETN